MLTAGQRCYSGPAAGGGLADRVSVSNASHAPTTGGGMHTLPPPLPCSATPRPRSTGLEETAAAPGMALGTRGRGRWREGRGQKSPIL